MVSHSAGVAVGGRGGDRIEEEIRLALPEPSGYAALREELTRRSQGAFFQDRSYRDFYLDHPDRLLLKSRLALRWRAGVGGARLEIKGEGVLQDGVWLRPEWCQEGCDVRPLRVDGIAAGPVRERLEALLGLDAPLEELCSCFVERHVMALSSEGGMLEVSLDRGVIRAGGREVGICELEIEWCGVGGRQAGIELARVLRERHGLTEAAHSKFRIGVGLLEGG
ncbi:MAG: CYTH domain-containing protein [Magnetococcus sp. YQC-9]